jgi:hypothetical protein
MSGRQLEEMQEARRIEMLAAALGTTRDELEQHDWDLDENVTSDGAPTGYTVTFAQGTDPEFLERVGAEDGWTTVPINAFDEPE